MASVTRIVHSWPIISDISPRDRDLIRFTAALAESERGGEAGGEAADNEVSAETTGLLQKQAVRRSGNGASV